MPGSPRHRLQIQSALLSSTDRGAAIATLSDWVRQLSLPREITSQTSATESLTRCQGSTIRVKACEERPFPTSGLSFLRQVRVHGGVCAVPGQALCGLVRQVCLTSLIFPRVLLYGTRTTATAGALGRTPRGTMCKHKHTCWYLNAILGDGELNDWQKTCPFFYNQPTNQKSSKVGASI